MSPIKGLTERRQMPRLGKIHLGVKKQSASGVEYPVAVEYFVCPPEVQGVFGERPTALSVVFPPAPVEEFTSQYYRSYSRTRGLVCKGDGETADRTVSVEAEHQFRTTGVVPPIADHQAKEVVRTEIPCPGQQCPYFQKGDCRGVMNLQFMLPSVPGIGIWQIDTSSTNSILRVNSGLAMMERLFGRVSGIPVNLTLEPLEVTGLEGRKKKVHVLDLRFPRVKLMEMAERVRKQAEETFVALPEPDGEMPSLLFPTAAAVQARAEAEAPAAPAPDHLAGLGGDQKRVLKELGYRTARDVRDAL
ncbi:MAG: hypothetical protein FJ315_08050, partial [SAR202 cluster bacterium]|nr:hypothetical protein [SAR202 cluster bacterium]